MRIVLRIRISGPAGADIARALATSRERWGDDAHARYTTLLAEALKGLARKPSPPTSKARSELGDGVRSFHVRHVRGSAGVKEPVHVVFYRVAGERLEVVRVLHERMEPTLHVKRTRRRAVRASSSRRR